MSRDSRRKSSVTRQILKEIINNQSSFPSTSRNPNSIEIIKLNEAVTFLEKKIERQYIQIKLLSDQLSKEISLKEELAVLFGEEKEKNSKIQQLLVNSNKQVGELKKKLVKMEQQEKGEGCIKQEYEIKLNKYRDFVRKKDELLTKNQLKIEELLKNQRKNICLEQDLKNLKDSFGKLKNREENQSVQLESLKKKNNQLEQSLQETQEMFKEQQTALMFAQQTIKRMQNEYDDLNQQSSETIEKAEAMHLQLRSVINFQKKQIEELSLFKLQKQKPEWSLQVYTNQIKRGLVINIKDQALRRKTEKLIMEVISEIQISFNSILQKVMNS